jgi:hypothetical protein
MWDIPSSFAFPLTDIRVTKRRFNRSWLEKYKWLRYSESENGVFCLCVRGKTNDDEYPIYFSAKTTFVGRQRLTCQRPDLNYLAELI